MVENQNGMEKDEVKNKVLEIFRSIMGEIPNLSEQTSADEVARWDSLNHIILIQELEKAFHLKFDLFAIIEVRDVAGLVESVFRHSKQ
jgi:acyl carrier protein